MRTAFIGLSAVAAVAQAQPVDFNAVKIMPGHDKMEDHTLPQPYEYLTNNDGVADEFPADFSWANKDGKMLVTKSLNQHIPQYCGSCWAHGAMSSLADRVKIARDGKGVDINLAIQFILNCGADIGGSCKGGTATGAFQFVKKTGYVPVDTCLQYEACSSDSQQGMCKGGDWTCSAENTCRTCSTFTTMGGKCAGISQFPNVTIAEYGTVVGEEKMMAEIQARGPIACGVNAGPLLKYEKGVFNKGIQGSVDHIVSVTGWGTTTAGEKYWTVRNSWGEYWGEMGYFRVARGQNELAVESACSWATPASWTEVNFPCHEGGGNCVSTAFYKDPALSHVSQQAQVVV